MDNQAVQSAVFDVMQQLGMGDRRFEIDTAMGSPNSESIQVRILDDTGDGKAVVIDFKDASGSVVDGSAMRERIRKQLETFAEIDRN
jgi:hypothetical protein